MAYLAEQYSVPINAVFFRHSVDGGSEHLARTWLIPPEEAESRPVRHRGTAAKGPPVERAGLLRGPRQRGEGHPPWEAGRAYDFVGAGGTWYSKPLRNLTPGKRVFAYVGGAGYVGIGEVTGAMVPLRELQVERGGRTLNVIDQPEVAAVMRERALSHDEEVTEFAVPVRWLAQRNVGDAVSERGIFSSQVTVCKLRDERTIELVTTALGAEELGE